MTAGSPGAQSDRIVRNRHLAPELEQAWPGECTGQAARVFKDFRYRTLDSWSRERRVIGKAEHLPGGANPRFVVTSLGPDTMAARALYEELYCARGRWRIASRSSSWRCLRTGPRRRRCRPTSRACILPPSCTAHGGLAALGLGGHAAGAGAMRHDPPEAAQGRRADPGQRAGRAAVVRRGLSGSGPVRAGAGPPPEPTAALLAVRAPDQRVEPRPSSPGSLRPSRGWHGRTSGKHLGSGRSDQGSARIRCLTL